MSVDEELLALGRITSPHGIKGWVKVSSQTEPAENIFDYQPWLMISRQGTETINVVNWRQQGKGFIAQLKQLNDRNEAEAFCPVDIYILKGDLPTLETGDYYWHQLEGCQVITEHQGTSSSLGVVKHLMPTGANDVLVVQSSNDSIDDRERLIPYVLDQFVKSIDIDKRLITVDWDPDF